MEGLGFKELYEVSLKSTYPIEVGNRKIEVGETVARFDKIQLANFEEHKKFFKTGNTSDAIWWEDTRDVQLSFSQGVFSKTQLAFLSNAKLLENSNEEPLKISCQEILESDEKGRLFTKHGIVRPYFVYNNITGEKVTEVSVNYKTIFTGVAYQEFLVDYCYEYDNNYKMLSVGSPLTNGYLSLEGKTRVKDDITGQIKTGIIRIPKLKLLSNLSMRLGQDAVPLVGRLDAIAVPTGERGQKKVMEIIFLSDDIDSDM